MTFHVHTFQNIPYTFQNILYGRRSCKYRPGRRPFEFVCGSLGKDFSRPLYNFRSLPGFSNFSSKQFPGGVKGRHPTPRDPKAHLAICKEIQELIQRNAIVQVDNFPLLCLSPIFVIPKKKGDLRVILNLKKINVFISVQQHFRMETLNVILPDLRPQDWAVSLDLKDAYLHVPVHPQSRRLLGFRFLSKTYVRGSFQG